MPTTALPLNRLYLAQGLSEPAWGDRDTLFYVRQADGKRSLVRQSLATGLAQVLTTEPQPAGGIGYGGGLFAVRGQMLVYAGKDNRLHGLDLTTGEQWPITPPAAGVAAPVISPDGRRVAFLGEQDNRCNVLVTELRGTSLPVKISQDPWYAFNPAFSPDGAWLAWQEWDEQNMPWDEARLRLARVAAPAEAPITLARPGVAYASPQFSPDGHWLAYTSDETGWRSLWVARPDGSQAVRIDTGAGEIGQADWVPGLRAMCWSADSQALYTIRYHASRAALLHIAWPAQTVRELPTDWTHLAGLNVSGHSLAFIGSNPTTPATLITLDAQTGQAHPRAATAIGLLDPAMLAQPEVISWPTTDNQTAWGILHRAVGPQATPGPRPLIVHVHGGPTGTTALQWLPQAQYFATRGWHYLEVNYRGSTGFGRAYQDALNGHWGNVDVADARTGAEHLVQLGLADAQRLVITGGSAGGYTTLMALTQHADFWAAGVALYGIGNLYDLKQGSHRFEVNYEERLIGPLPQSGRLWKDRSPLTHVKNVRAPVLLFHGQADKAVPYQQSVEFAEAVKHQGGLAELTLYPDEGHGFMREANRKDQLEKMEAFLEKYVICMQRS